jgi:hypothetical protein
MRANDALYNKQLQGVSNCAIPWAAAQRTDRFGSSCLPAAGIKAERRLAVHLHHTHVILPSPAYLKKCISLLGIFYMCILKCVFLYRVTGRFGRSRPAVIAVQDRQYLPVKIGVPYVA